MAAKQQQQPKAEEWDEGVVRFIITDHKGKETLQQQMCWNMGKFIESQTAQALAAQCSKDETKHYKFRVVG